MHAFEESLKYVFLTKFYQHMSDMTAVIVLKFKKKSPVQFPYNLTKR